LSRSKDLKYITYKGNEQKIIGLAQSNNLIKKATHNKQKNHGFGAKSRFEFISNHMRKRRKIMGFNHSEHLRFMTYIKEMSKKIMGLGQSIGLNLYQIT